MLAGAVLIAVAAGGCGESTAGGRRAPGRTATARTFGSTRSGAGVGRLLVFDPGSREAAGAEVFRASCAGCHSLVGDDRLHRVGGDLVHPRISRSQLRTYAAEMPVRRPLSSRQLDAVTAYVAAVQAAG